MNENNTGNPTTPTEVDHETTPDPAVETTVTVEETTTSTAETSSTVDENETDKWKSLSKKWEDRAKENLNKLKTLEPVAEKAKVLQENYDKLSKEIVQLRKASTISKYNLPPEAEEFLNASDPKNLEAEAEKLSKLLKTTTSQPKNKWVLPPTNQGSDNPPTLGKIKTKEEFQNLLKSQKNV